MTAHAYARGCTAAASCGDLRRVGGAQRGLEPSCTSSCTSSKQAAYLNTPRPFEVPPGMRRSAQRVEAAARAQRRGRQSSSARRGVAWRGLVRCKESLGTASSALLGSGHSAAMFSASATLLLDEAKGGVLIRRGTTGQQGIWDTHTLRDHGLDEF